ncbi:hypothetical protein ACXYRP_01620 [Mycoplasma sp. 5912]
MHMYFDTKNNYLERKIYLAIISVFLAIVIILQATLYTRFYAQIQLEYNYILNSDTAAGFTPAQVYANSPSYQLKEVFWSLNSISIFLSLVALLTLIYMQVMLYKNKSNSDKTFIYLFALIPAIFIALFFINALQPDQTFKNNYTLIITDNAKSYTPIQTGDLPRINYTTSWIAMILAFICIVLIIVAKKRYGFVKKDKILATKAHDTQKLKVEINALLNNSK